MIEETHKQLMLRFWIPNIIYDLLCLLDDYKREINNINELFVISLLNVIAEETYRLIPQSLSILPSDRSVESLMRFLNLVSKEYEWTLRKIPVSIAWNYLPSRCTITISSEFKLHKRKIIILSLNPSVENIEDIELSVLRRETGWEIDIPDQYRSMIGTDINLEKSELFISVFGHYISGCPYQLKYLKEQNATPHSRFEKETECCIC